VLIANVYLKFEGSLNDLALYLRSKLNIAENNLSGLEQYRYGLNRGGEYYLFEFFGMELILIINKGEVLEENYEEYQYYLVIYTEVTIEDTIFSCVIQFLVEVLKSDAVTIEVEFR
jgi:hypothetical protein